MRANGLNLYTRWMGMPRYDKEIYALILGIYAWLFIFIPDIWLRDATGMLIAFPRMSWVVIFLLTTDLTYCYYEYGLVLDFKRDFNFYASMTIIAAIVIFYIMLIWFW